MRTLARKKNQTKRQASDNFTRVSTATSAASRKEHPILQLQHTIGNHAMQGLLQAMAAGLDRPGNSATTRWAHDCSRIPVYAKPSLKIQTELTVNSTGDQYDQEADRIADHEMQLPPLQLKHTCPCNGGCVKCQTEQPEQEP